jgi:hypothetical protein
MRWLCACAAWHGDYEPGLTCELRRIEDQDAGARSIGPAAKVEVSCGRWITPVAALLKIRSSALHFGAATI